MADDQKPKFVPAVQNATAILRLLAARGAPLGASQIARETGLNPSSAFNILRTLAHEGMISFDPVAKTYRIGMGIMEFAAPLLGANPADQIRPLMNAVAQDHRAMIALWQITASERMVLIDRFTAPDIVHAVIAPQTRLPIFAGAVGRCYAALRGLDRTQARRGYDQVHWQAAPGFEAYWRDVQAARTTGIARDHEALFRGLQIVATLVRDAHDAPRLGLSAITITGQHRDDEIAHIGQALADAARQIERNLFGRSASR